MVNFLINNGGYSSILSNFAIKPPSFLERDEEIGHKYNSNSILIKKQKHNEKKLSRFSGSIAGNSN